MVETFAFGNVPAIHFGTGKIALLPSIINNYGNRGLIITGGRSFVSGPYWSALQEQMETLGIGFDHATIAREPSPGDVDGIVDRHRDTAVDVVVAIGGGSVLDAGKAVAAMLQHEGSVMHYLEGVGDRSPTGATLPFVAVPTTAGTGAEASKNAVLSEVGNDGYKKSLRHDGFVPRVALVDPQLALACPPELTAQSGMDAFTQLLESYLSTAANAMTDALALPALQCIARALPLAVERGNDNIEARADMAYAALISGITLANAGLGVVHGFASSIGGRYAIPHGLICGTLMGVANRKNVQMLRDEAPGHTALAKYEKVGRLFHDSSDQSGDYYIDHLLHTIDAWTERFQLSRLGHFGVTAGDIKALAADTGNKNNPLPLSQQAREDILSARL